MSKTVTAGKWNFVETDGQVAVSFNNVLVDTLDAAGVGALGVAAINSVLPASALPLATLLEGVVGQAIKALE